MIELRTLSAYTGIKCSSLIVNKIKGLEALLKHNEAHYLLCNYHYTNTWISSRYVCIVSTLNQPIAMSGLTNYCR